MITLIVQAVFYTVLLSALSRILWDIDKALCQALDFLESVFEKFAGLSPILYRPDAKSVVYDPATGGAKIVNDGVDVAREANLLEIVFGNTTINKIYWNMAIIGFAMVFAFAIFAVIKKMFDVNDKMKQTLGQIIGNAGKAILLICSLNIFVSVALSGSQILLEQMDMVFRESGSMETSTTITFDDQDYAHMLHAINTIGNYSLNKSYNSRFNLNACYNAIREDLEYLDDKGKFIVPYRLEVTTYDPETGEAIIGKSGEDTWQSVLYDIAAGDNGSDVCIDAYSETRNEALLNAMEIIRTKEDFYPLEKYVVTLGATGPEDYKIGKLVMLIGTMDAAEDDKYNQNMAFTDDLRSRYLFGERDIYSITQVSSHFKYRIGTWHHLLVMVFAVIFIKQYLGMCFSAVARVFNMLFLYLIAPPFIAVLPLDDGGKTKQWTTAFIIQTFSLFGIVLSMRLYKVIMPMVVNTNVVFFPNSSRYQMMAQALFMLACSMVVKKAGGMITGILADNAGMQAISAGDMMGEAGALFDKVTQKGIGIAKAGFGAVKGMAKQGTGIADKKIEQGQKNNTNKEGAKDSQKSPTQGTPSKNSQNGSPNGNGQQIEMQDLNPDGKIKGSETNTPPGGGTPPQSKQPPVPPKPNDKNKENKYQNQMKQQGVMGNLDQLNAQRHQPNTNANQQNNQNKGAQQNNNQTNQPQQPKQPPQQPPKKPKMGGDPLGGQKANDISEKVNANLKGGKPFGKL